MTVPKYRSHGALAVAAGGITPDLPAGWQVDDILILALFTANEAISVVSPAGWQEVTNSPQGTGIAGGATASRLTLFWKRAEAGDTAPTTTDSGAVNMGRIAAFSGCETSGSPFDITDGDVEETDITDVVIPGGTPTVEQCLIALFVATGADVTKSMEVDGWTNPDLTLSGAPIGPERFDNWVATGVGGGIAMATYEKDIAEAFGATTATLADANSQGRMMVALKPPAPVVNPPLHAYETELRAKGVMSWWPLDEASGTTLRDAMGRDHMTIAGGAPLLDQDGPTSLLRAISFDGVDDYTHGDPINEIRPAASSCVWLKTPTPGQGHGHGAWLVGADGSTAGGTESPHGLWEQFGTDQWNWHYRDDVNVARDLPFGEVVADQWEFVAWTIDATGVRVYQAVAGVVTEVASDLVNVSFFMAAVHRLGSGKNNPPGNFGEYSVAAPAFFDSVLTTQDLQDIYDAAQDAGTTPVGKAVSLQWNTLTTIGETEALQWDVLGTVSESEQLVWDLAAVVGEAIQVLWDVAAFDQAAISVTVDVPRYKWRTLEVTQ